MDPKPPLPKMDSEEFKLWLQLETSLLVWTRTSLSLMGFGFVVARFGLFLREISEAGGAILTPHPTLAALNTVTGTVLIVLGVVVQVISVWSHRRMVVELERGHLSKPLGWSMGVILGLVLAALGIGMAVYLTLVAV
jgi:putative membrane protein